MAGCIWHCPQRMEPQQWTSLKAHGRCLAGPPSPCSNVSVLQHPVGSVLKALSPAKMFGVTPTLQLASRVVHPGCSWGFLSFNSLQGGTGTGDHRTPFCTNKCVVRLLRSHSTGKVQLGCKRRVRMRRCCMWPFLRLNWDPWSVQKRSWVPLPYDTIVEARLS